MYSRLFLNGALLALLGISVAIFPALLVALISSLFIFAGCALIALGFGLRRSEQIASRQRVWVRYW